MHEITPSLIAEIATRMLSELPGANQVPRTEVGAEQLPREAQAMPGAYGAAPPAAQMPPGVSDAPAGHFPASHGDQHPHVQPSASGTSLGHTVPGHTSPTHATPAQASQFTPTHTSPYSASGPAHGSSQSTPSTAHLTPQRSDGISEFVRRIQSGHTSSPSGLCVDDPHQDPLRQLFSRGIPSVEKTRPFDVAAIRRDFPILHQEVHGKPLAWFDNAATTQKPQSVIDALSRFYAHDNSNIHRGAHTLAARATDAFEQARQKVQAFIGAPSAKEIIFVRGTTEGVNLVAQTWGRKFLQPGDEVVLSTLEHHANIVPWQMIAREKGAVLRIIPVNDRGEIMLEQYQALLGPRTRFVALAHASNSLGTILPVAEMTQMAKRYNARVLIDGAQSVAHLPVNVEQLGCDFFVFSGHKIFGPTGIGVVYARQELEEIMPPWQGGGNMIRNVTFEETSYSDPPAKFEAGTPNIADAVGLGAALDYVSRLGLPNIGRYEHELLEYATEKLVRINGLRLIGTAREKVGVLSFVMAGRRTEDVGRMLDLEGIAVRAGHHCSQPSLRRFGVETTVRPSLSLYNTKEEVDRLADAVRRISQRSDGVSLPNVPPA